MLKYKFNLISLTSLSYLYFLQIKEKRIYANNFGTLLIFARGQTEKPVKIQATMA